ncbi:hypothetical protein HDV02_002943 [Globomyces sp. JEL0801]|nr:hypothetical protein HDV02_002943 [Globomyces sp. JEL0801]
MLANYATATDEFFKNVNENCPPSIVKAIDREHNPLFSNAITPTSDRFIFAPAVYAGCLMGGLACDKVGIPAWCTSVCTKFLKCCVQLPWNIKPCMDRIAEGEC